MSNKAFNRSFVISPALIQEEVFNYHNRELTLDEANLIADYVEEGLYERYDELVFQAVSNVLTPDNGK